MAKKFPPVAYTDYLKIDELLNLQNPLSTHYGDTAHDEYLFIIIHQVYELWFKQILVELDSVRNLFEADLVDEKNMGVAVARLDRIIRIQKIMVDQVNVLESMTPLDFLDFRSMLFPASGFQSKQFRLVENKLGLEREKRLTYNDAAYTQSLAGRDRPAVEQSEQEPSLFALIERWLERTPFLEVGSFNFWKSYQKAVEDYFQRDREWVRSDKGLNDAERERRFAEIEKNEAVFESIFDTKKYEDLRKEGAWRFSFRALHAALFIELYRDQPILQQPFRLLTCLQDIDEGFNNWRYRHAMMVHRMLGEKIGTGGSSGHRYLRATADSHKIFKDLANLATFLLPRSELPRLPREFEELLGFTYTQRESTSP